MLSSVRAFGIDRDVRVEQLAHTAWTAKDGVPADVRNIAQTPDGALWIGGGSGLYRFDGIRFMRFQPSEGLDLPKLPIISLSVDSDGSLWTGFDPAGISHIQDGKVTTYSEKEGLPPGVGRRVIRDSSGTLWAVTTSGLAQFDGTRWKRIGSEWHSPTGTPVCAYNDREGRLWIGTLDALFYLPKGTHEFKMAEGNVEFVADIAETADGNIWIADLGRNVRPVQGPWHPGKIPVTKLRVGGISLLVDHQGSFWIGTGGDGLRRIANPEDVVGRDIAEFSTDAEIFGRKQGLSDDYVRAIFEDREGSIWLATVGGIDRFRQTPLISMPLPPGSVGISLARGPNGRVWAAVTNRNFGAFNGNRYSSTKYGACSGSTNGPEGTAWFSCSNYLLEIDGDRVKTWKVPFKATSRGRGAAAVAEDSAGMLWVVFQNYGVYRVNKGKWSQFEAGTDTLHDVRAAYADPDGSVWFGHEDGLLEVERDGKISRTFSAVDIGLRRINVIRGQGKSIWIGGPQGIVRWDGTIFRKLIPSRAAGLADVADLIATERDGIWVEADNELLHMTQSEVDRFRLDPGYRVSLQVFNALDGLSSGFTQGSSNQKAIVGSDGRYWFGSEEGLFGINPRSAPPSPAPSVSVLSLTANGQEHQTSAAIHLPAHTTGLKIDYTAWTAGIPERVRFRYQLKGVDSDWQDAGSTRAAIYTNLGPGTYEFLVSASHLDGDWTAQPARISFQINAAFYQTLWFKLIEALAALWLFGLVIRFRNRQAAKKIENQMRERLMERDRIARELHDTLLQGFQGLVLRFQMAANAIPPNERSRTMMEDTLNRADSVLAEGRERVRDLRSHEGTAIDLVEAIHEIADELSLEDTGIFKVIVLGQTCPFHPVVRDELEAIAKEAITNAFRHANASEIICELSFNQDFFHLACRDNGSGITAEFLSLTGREGHWGLIGMRERAEKIGATLKISRGEERGTTLEVKLRSRLAYVTGANRWRSMFRRPE